MCDLSLSFVVIICCFIPEGTVPQQNHMRYQPMRKYYFNFLGKVEHKVSILAILSEQSHLTKKLHGFKILVDPAVMPRDDGFSLFSVG